MPIDPFTGRLILSGIGALGGLFGNRKQTTEQRQRQNQYQNYNNQQFNSQQQYGKSTPTYDPLSWQYRNELIDQAGARTRLPVGDPGALARSQLTQNLWNIGEGSALQNKLLQQRLASQGINYGAMGDAPRQQQEASRIQQLLQARNQLPQLQRQYELENEQLSQGRLGQAMQLFGMIPKGTETESQTGSQQYTSGESSSESDMFGTNTTPGNMAAGGLQGFGIGLAGMFGNRAGSQQAPNYGYPDLDYDYGRTTSGGINPNWQMPNVPLYRPPQYTQYKTP